MLNRRPLRAALMAAAILASEHASAIPFGSTPITVTLAPGVTAERFPHSCGNWAVYTSTCLYWRLDGATAPPEILERANMFAGARHGRIVAALPDGIAFTDDRGAHWLRGRWEGSSQPLSLAFDARSDFGVAVGTNGGVFVTDDRGETWRSRRDDPGRRLVDVALAGRTVVFVDDHDGAWVSTDGGSSVRTLVDPATAGGAPVRIDQVGERIDVTIGGVPTYRADASGGVERLPRP